MNYGYSQKNLKIIEKNQQVNDSSKAENNYKSDFCLLLKLLIILNLIFLVTCELLQ